MDYTGIQNQRSVYKKLGNVNMCDQLPKCLARMKETRSDKDIMMYDLYVLGEPMRLAPPSSIQNKGWPTYKY